MPPTTRRSMKKASTKSSGIGPKKQKKTAAAVSAKQRNQAFLREALNSSLAESGNEYSETGHEFVSVEQAGSFGQFIKTDPMDPLNLSQIGEPEPEQNRTIQEPVTDRTFPLNLSQNAGQYAVLESKTETQTVQEFVAGGTYPLNLSQCAILEPEPEQNQTVQEATAYDSNLLPSKSLEPNNRCTTKLQPDPLPKSVPSPLSLLPSSSTLPPERDSLVAVVADNLQDGLPDDGRSDDDQSDDGNSDDGKSDEEITDDSKSEEEINKKYAALLLKYQKQTDKLKQIQKKHAQLKRKHAEMKDLLVYTVAEAKKAKMDPNSITPFAADPDIDMPVDRIQEINNMSKNVGNFAQNLAISMYGAADLRNRSVTGTSCNRMKGTVMAKPRISPKKMKFIYAKARERVELEVGSRNSEQIGILAHKTIINRAIAEKIANLRKAAKNATKDLQPADPDNNSR